MSNNQVEYPTSGKYVGTAMISPALLPEPTVAAQSAPNIVTPSSTMVGSGTTESTQATVAIKTNHGFGIISVPTQNSIVANTYLDTLNIIPGNNVTILTDPAQKAVTISAGTGTFLGGTSISVVQNGNNTTTINNTMTETVFNGGSANTYITPIRDNGSVQKFTLTDNFTLNTPLNMQVGQSLSLILTQDTIGSRLMDANSQYLFASGFQTLSIDSGAIDMLNIFKVDTATYFVTLTVNYS